MNNQELIESICKELGNVAVHRHMMMDALEFLDENESGWYLDEPIDRRLYLLDLLSRARKRT